MAINIDTVYQKVLAIANKEQRGYINPQQFNLFANQAQLDIFEDYFFKLNQLEFGQKNSTQYADLKNILLEKIQPFEKTGALTYQFDGNEKIPSYSSPSDLYRIGSIRYLDVGSNLCTDPTFSDASGTEMLTNGTFTGNANSWNLQKLAPNNNPYGGYSNNTMLFQGSGFNMRFWQEHSQLAHGDKFHPEKTYRVSFDVSGHVVGGLAVWIMAGDANSGTAQVRRRYGKFFFPGHIGNGSFVCDIKPDAQNNNYNSLENGIYFARDTNTYVIGQNTGVGGAYNDFAIDNISVKEVGNEWTVTPANSWHFGNGTEYNGKPLLEYETLPAGNSNPIYGGNRKFVWTFNGDQLQKAWAPGANETWMPAQQSPLVPPTHGYLQNALTLVQSSTYELRYTVGGATTGKLYLANHLHVDMPNNKIADGSMNNLLLWKSGDPHNEYTKYFVQGSQNTDKLSIYRSEDFNGYISNISVKLISSDTDGVEVQAIRGNELTNVLNSKLVKPSTKRPVYVKNENGINVYPNTITDGVSCYYIKKPLEVSWNYTEINSVPMYNSGSSVDFELHDSEENTLVSKILTLAGINIKDQELIQIGMAKEAQAK